MRGLKYISWADNSGYGIAAKAYVEALTHAGVEITWTPMLPDIAGYTERPHISWPDEPLRRVCNSSMEYDTVLLHTVPEYFPALAERERGAARRIVGYTVWELETLPAHWPRILNQLDAVIVPCRWNKDVFRRCGVTVPVHVVPHLSQSNLGKTADHADRAGLLARLRLPSDRPFIFYTIGAWSHRKAPYLALEAYCRAFHSRDPVLLVIKTNERDFTSWQRGWRHGFRRRHPSPVQTAAAITQSFPSAAPVAVIAEDRLTDGEMLALHEVGDCFISLARAEGWGLGAFEAASLGNPVLMTGHGGQMDYLNERDAMLVDFELVPVHEPAFAASYPATSRWANPSIADAVRKLRSAFDDQQTVRQGGRRLAESIAGSFSRRTLLDTMLRTLQ